MVSLRHVQTNLLFQLVNSFRVFQSKKVAIVTIQPSPCLTTWGGGCSRGRLAGRGGGGGCASYLSDVFAEQQSTFLLVCADFKYTFVLAQNLRRKCAPVLWAFACIFAFTIAVRQLTSTPKNFSRERGFTDRKEMIMKCRMRLWNMAVKRVGGQKKSGRSKE